jgi:hypothetical protein
MMDGVLASLEETFNKSALDALRSYVSLHPQCRKWLVYSDYCIHDKTKPNDVVSFVVVPYDTPFEVERTLTDNLAPVDWKKTVSVNPSFLAYLRGPRLFYLSIILENTRGLTRHPDMKPRRVVVSQIEATMRIIESWSEDANYNVDYCSAVLRRLRHLSQRMDRPSANLTLYRDILLVSALAGFICHKLGDISKATMTGWFSDRDKIIEAYEGIAFDFAFLNHHALCEKHGVDSSQTKMTFGVVSPDAEGKPWYDEMNRLPDYVAGALADWDLPRDIVTKNKTCQMLLRVIADNPRFVLLRLGSDDEGIRWSRISISAKPG